MKRFARKLAAAGVALAVAYPAFAELQRVGPVTQTHGFPDWYQDASGLALEFCTANDQATLNGGWCLTLPADVPAGTAPEIFPTNFSVEHFYWSGFATTPAAGVDLARGTSGAGIGNVSLVMGLEASFATGAVDPGSQITFGRWRVRMLNAPCTGSYTFFTPNKAPQTYSVTVGGQIFQTDDFGIGAPGVFTGALGSSIGPFLRPLGANGQPAPTVTGPDGKQYISNGADLVPIIGSSIPNNHPLRPAATAAMANTNYFAVVGPGISTGVCANTTESVVQTSFALTGRVFDGPVPTRAVVDRVTYKYSATANGGTPGFLIGGYANALQETGKPAPELGMSLYEDAGVATSFTTETAFKRFPGVSQTPTQAIPGQPVTTPSYNFFHGSAVPTNVIAGATQNSPKVKGARVRTLTDVPPSAQDLALVDDVRITNVLYNATTRNLTVTAESGAYLTASSGTAPAAGSTTPRVCSTPCLYLEGAGLPLPAAPETRHNFVITNLPGGAASGTVTVANVDAPPNVLTVRSTAGGKDTVPVRYTAGSAVTALIQDDIASTAVNLAVQIPVMANDIGVAVTPALRVCTTAASFPTAAAQGAACPLATTAALVNGTAATPLGGRVKVVGNTIEYTPPLNAQNITDVFYYQVNTLPSNAVSLKAKVSVNVGSNQGPLAIGDGPLTTVVGNTLSVNVLANDIAPAGFAVGTLRVVTNDLVAANGTRTPATGAGVNPTTGLIDFTPTVAGRYLIGYQFADRAGTLSSLGVLDVNVLGQETLTGVGAFRTGRGLTASGTTTIGQGQIITVRNASGVANACGAANRNTLPLLGQSAPVAAVAGGFGWDMALVANVTVAPSSLVAISPLGGCVQFVPTVR